MQACRAARDPWGRIASMRTALLASVLLLVIPWQIFGQDGRCIGMQSDDEDSSETNFVEHWLDGTFGQKQVRMYLGIGTTEVGGAFDFLEDWNISEKRDTSVIFHGTNRDGTIQATELKDGDPRKGALQGRLTADGFSGSWTPKNQTGPVPVELKSTPPTDCSGAKETWIRYDDPRMPFAFSYPASWLARKGSDRDEIDLYCPDPSLISAGGNPVSISWGAQTGNSDKDFGMVRCGEHWYTSRCDCEDAAISAFCSPAPVTESHGITILDGDAREWRSYCRDGGYLGQYSGHDRTLLFDGNWADIIGEQEPSEIIDRIVTTVKVRHKTRRAGNPRSPQAQEPVPLGRWR